MRDKVDSPFELNFRTTGQIIAHADELPPYIMFTIHPERSSEAFFPWLRELVWQNVKNGGKYIIATRNAHSA